MTYGTEQPGLVLAHREDFDGLVNRCDEAETSGKIQFRYQGNDILVSYARFLIEHLLAIGAKELPRRDTDGL